MALSININVPSLNAQRHLDETTSSYNTALERLSSGLRINSASDDAAGLAISDGLTAQTNGLNQASRNANDGLSLLGTAEAAISTQVDLVQRLRELAVQSSSDTNSSTNRAALNEEASQLISEFERVARTSEFNGVSLLDGSFTSKSLQIGANSSANDRISVDLDSTRSADIGSAYTLATTAGTGVSGTALTADEMQVVVDGTSYSVGASVDDGYGDAGSALAVATAINAISSDTGVSASAETVITGVAAQTAGSTATGDVSINGVDIDGVTTSVGGSAIISAINAKASETGVSAELNDSGIVELTASDGRDIDLVIANGAGTLTGLTAADGTTNKHGDVTMSSVNSFSVSGDAADLALAGGATDASVDSTKNVGSVDLSSQDDSLEAIDILDTALTELDTMLANIGAQTNRLDSIISNLAVAAENASSANSQILDADFSSETATLTKSQILQQAGVAVLSQANQSPQLALSLLG